MSTQQPVREMGGAEEEGALEVGDGRRGGVDTQQLRECEESLRCSVSPPPLPQERTPA